MPKPKEEVVKQVSGIGHPLISVPPGQVTMSVGHTVGHFAWQLSVGPCKQEKLSYTEMH